MYWQLSKEARPPLEPARQAGKARTAGRTPRERQPAPPMSYILSSSAASPQLSTSSLVSCYSEIKQSPRMQSHTGLTRGYHDVSPSTGIQAENERVWRRHRKSARNPPSGSPQKRRDVVNTTLDTLLIRTIDADLAWNDQGLASRKRGERQKAARAPVHLERDVAEGQDLGRVAAEAVVVINDVLRNTREVLDVLLTQVVEQLAEAPVEPGPFGALELGATQLKQNLVICASAGIRQHLRTVSGERAQSGQPSRAAGNHVPGSFIVSKCWYSQSAPLGHCRPSSWLGHTGCLGSILLL